MNREELKKRFNEEWIPPFEYSLYGENDEGLIIEPLQDNTWKVYVRERGKNFSERFFKTEAEACQFSYDKILAIYGNLSQEKRKEIKEFIIKHYKSSFGI